MNKSRVNMKAEAMKAEVLGGGLPGPLSFNVVLHHLQIVML